MRISKKAGLDHPTLNEVLILAALRKSGEKDVDVPSIQNCLYQRSSLVTYDGSVRSTLAKMVSRGLASRAERRAHVCESRVLYSITPEGSSVLDDWLLAVMEMA